MKWFHTYCNSISPRVRRISSFSTKLSESLKESRRFAVNELVRIFDEPSLLGRFGWGDPATQLTQIATVDKFLN